MLGTDGGVGDQNTHKGDCWEGNAENPSPSLSIQHGDPAALTRGLSALCAAGRIRPILHSPGAPTLPRPCVGPSAALRPPRRVLPVNSNEGGMSIPAPICAPNQHRTPTAHCGRPYGALWGAVKIYGNVWKNRNFGAFLPFRFIFVRKGSRAHSRHGSARLLLRRSAKGTGGSSPSAVSREALGAPAAFFF